MPQTGAGATQFYNMSAETGKAIFDDKVAIAESMKYQTAVRTDGEVPIEKKFGWSRIARNYFISRAQEMQQLLLWAESFQTTTISQAHIEEIAQQGWCMDHFAAKLSRDLLGYFNLNIPPSEQGPKLFRQRNWRKQIGRMEENYRAHWAER